MGKKNNNFENSYMVWAFTSRWVSSCCSANSCEPENGPIKSPWVLPLCLQSLPFTVGEAALVDYNIAAVHAKILRIKEKTGMCALFVFSSFGRDFFTNQDWSVLHHCTCVSYCTLHLKWHWGKSYQQICNWVHFYFYQLCLLPALGAQYGILIHSHPPV